MPDRKELYAVTDRVPDIVLTDGRRRGRRGQGAQENQNRRKAMKTLLEAIGPFIFEGLYDFGCYAMQLLP
jgi:hypothetical protein